MHDLAVALGRTGNLPCGCPPDQSTRRAIAILQQLAHCERRTQWSAVRAAVVAHDAVGREVSEHGPRCRIRRADAWRIRRKMRGRWRQKTFADQTAKRDHPRRQWLAMNRIW